MTPDKDGWIKHDGGPCPVAPGRLVMVNDGDMDVSITDFAEAASRAIRAALKETDNG